MNRRVLHAVAALAVFVTASLAWVQPAHAAPTAEMCSLEEWRNPKNFVECARRAKEKVGNELSCVRAPTPGTPNAGMAGFFATRPDSSLRDGVTGMYSMYGVGGYGLDTYDLGCLGTVKNPSLTFWNTTASAEFATAASIMAASNALRERAYDPGSMWGWSDQLLQAATDAVFRWVFTPFGAVALAIAGMWLIWRSRYGNMSETVKVTAWALFVIFAVTGLARWPVAAADGADYAASAGLKVMHRVLGPAPQDIPADKCVLGGEACKDNRSVAVRSADAATEAVLYRTWLRAVLGSADSAVAQKYGPALYDATALTWGEAARAQQEPELRQQLIDEKGQRFTAIAAAIREEDPAAYEHLQGVHGMDRAGAGVVAVLSALFFALFDVMASLVILFAFLVFRIAIIAIPLLGTIGVFYPASAGLRRVFHMTVAAAFNIVVFGGAAGLYLTSVVFIFNSSLPGAVQMIAVLLAGVGCLLVMHPLRHLVHTATGRSRAEDGFGIRMLRLGKQIHDQQQTPEPAAAPATPAGTPAAPTPPRPRPEAATAPSAPASRPATTKAVVTAVAPTVATAVGTATGHPWVGAAVAAASNGRTPRPETRK